MNTSTNTSTTTNNTKKDSNIDNEFSWLCCNKKVPCVQYCNSPHYKYRCGIIEKSKYNKVQ